MGFIIVLGLGVGLGLLGVFRFLVGKRSTVLGDLLAVDNAVPQRINVAPELTLQEKLENSVSRWVKDNPRVARFIGADLSADLGILGLDPMAHLVQKCVLALVLFVASPIVLVLIAMSWGIPVLSTVWLAIVLALLGFVLPDSGVRRKAMIRRRDFSATMMSYLDLVALRTASGSGVSEALRDASSVGTGYGWQRVRMSLADARFAGQSPSYGLATLGKQLDLPELSDLAAQLGVVDETGAQTESTLRAKAGAMRTKARALLEGGANARSTTMLIGQVGLAIGFLTLLGYPALLKITTM